MNEKKGDILMGKVIITGVDGNFGSHAAKTILNKMDSKDLIFTSMDHMITA